MGVTVAPATPADRDDVVGLWREAGLTRSWNDPVADFDMAQASPASAILVARVGQRVVASAMVGFDGHRGWIYYFSVAPAQRGQGPGRQLMRESERWLMQRQCPKIQLMVRGDNSAARGFYAALGYESQDVVTLGRRLDGDPDV